MIALVWQSPALLVLLLLVAFRRSMTMHLVESLLLVAMSLLLALPTAQLWQLLLLLLFPKRP